ncbi:hypothetical protein GCM10022226_06540 [Sphaerisporangium flaviroseum]|uniref:Uncharacterized protein n=1 Tax=Sphaerisporangium flaviroseum TaxID=509199 RepID=A0ABP7HF78_9ACTN
MEGAEASLAVTRGPPGPRPWRQMERPGRHSKASAPCLGTTNTHRPASPAERVAAEGGEPPVAQAPDGFPETKSGNVVPTSSHTLAKAKVILS